MISPVDMLLFGSKKVEFIEGLVRLDNWLNLKMNPNHAASIVSLRRSIEELVTRCTANPETFFPLNFLDQKLVNLVGELTKMDYHTGNNEEGGNGNQWRGRGMGMNRGSFRPNFDSSNPNPEEEAEPEEEEASETGYVDI